MSNNITKTYYYTGGYTMPTKLGSGETVAPSCPGIACFVWDEAEGNLTLQSITKEGAENPTWMMTAPNAPYLYTVNELKNIADAQGGAVSAYKIDPATGALTFLGRQVTAGEDPCHVNIAGNGKFLLNANYSGGSFCVFPIRDDHSLAPMTCLFKHSGKGPDASRQAMAHPHQILRAPGELGEKRIYISDLGLDQLVCYELNEETGWLEKSDVPPICGNPGQGTRHATFNADGTRVYVMAEMACEVNVYRYDPPTGENELLQVISAMGDETGEECLGAELHVHPSGKWLYASVRRSNHIAVFEIDPQGLLTLKQTIGSGGEIPRDFVLSPGGGYLLAANQDTGNIRIFKIDPQTGHLTVHRDICENVGPTVLAVYTSH